MQHDKSLVLNGRINKLEMGIVAEAAAAIRGKQWRKIPELLGSIDLAERMRNQYGYWAADGLLLRQKGCHRLKFALNPKVAKRRPEVAGLVKALRGEKKRSRE